MEQATSSVLADVQPKPKRKRMLLKWSLLGTILVLGYFMWQCGSAMSAGARLSDNSVRHFHSQLDAKAFDDIVREADEALQESKRDEMLKLLAGVHSKLGLLHGSTRTNILWKATTNGTLIKVTYQSTFEHGDAVEAFTWRRAGDGLKLVGYDISSMAFLTR